MKKILYVAAVICMIYSFITPTSTQAYNWGMKKGRDGNPAEAGQKFDEMLPKYEALYLGDTSKKIFI